jgi:hypothetical protein
MLDPNNHRGKFGEDYVRVLASAAGLTVYKDDVDFDGIDLGIRLPNPRRSFSRAIEVQVKTTSTPQWQGPELVFDGLDRRQFNRLAGDGYTVPRFLFVVTVPREPDEYTDVYTSGLLLRNIGYYLSLQDRPPLDVPETRSRVRVRVPAANVLSVAALRRLVDGCTP